MSGQWEIVGKPKKKQIVVKAKIKSEQVVDSYPKVEGTIPLPQVQSLSNALSKEMKENKKPGEENYVKDRVFKITQKKSKPKKKDFSKEKPELPKNLEIAVKLLNKKELCSELKSGQEGFADSPLVWLKGLVGYLNVRLSVENVHPVFEGKSHEYPQCLLPRDLHDVLKQCMANINEVVSQALFEWCLTAMASDMSRGDKTCEAVLGYKLIVQLLAFHNPSIVIAAIPKVKLLLVSYQNQRSIGLSLLWIMGQGGYKDLGVGIRVWREVMLPLVDLRLYSAYVVSYLRSILRLQPHSKNLEADNLLATLNVLCSPPDTIPTNKQKEIKEMSSKLMDCVLELPYETVFLPLFPTLLQQLSVDAPAHLQSELESVLLAGLLADARVSTVWLEVYFHFLPQSRLLLSHIKRSWNQVPKSVYSQLKKMLVGFQLVNRGLEKQKNTNSIALSCEEVTKELLSRMATARSRAAAASGFPWLQANLLLLAAIAALLTYDVLRHGSLRDSSTGHFLNDLGFLPYIEEGLSLTRSSSHQSYRWLQSNAPEYYKRACDFSRPYVVKGLEFLLSASSYIVAGCRTVYTYAEEQAPVVSKWIEQWAPGLRDQIIEMSVQVWEQGKIYGIAGGQYLIEYGKEAITWAQTNVFVGSWSPDNLHQYSLDVLNATQKYALGTYNWLYEKVQTYSKVE